MTGASMDLAALKNEIDTDPTTKGYAAHLPAAPGHVVDLLNAQTERMVKSRYVTARTVLAECAEGAVILDTLEAIGNQISAVKWAMKFLGQEGGLDVGNAATQGMLDQLEGGGLLTVEQATALKNLGSLPASRGEILGLGRVTEQDLRNAGVTI
jgi:hypothetical protein